MMVFLRQWAVARRELDVRRLGRTERAVSGDRPDVARGSRRAGAPDRWPFDGSARSSAAIVTFHLVLITWVFFRAASLSDAVTVLSRVGGAAARCRAAGEPPRFPELLVSVGLIVLLLAVEWLDERRPLWSRLGRARCTCDGRRTMRCYSV